MTKILSKAASTSAAAVIDPKTGYIAGTTKTVKTNTTTKTDANEEEAATISTRAEAIEAIHDLEHEVATICKELRRAKGVSQDWVDSRKQEANDLINRIEALITGYAREDEREAALQDFVAGNREDLAEAITKADIIPATTLTELVQLQASTSAVISAAMSEAKAATTEEDRAAAEAKAYAADDAYHAALQRVATAGLLGSAGDADAAIQLLPSLEGSEKQVRWAADIRRGYLTAIDKIAAAGMMRGVTELDVRIARLNTIVTLAGMSEAKDIIDLRYRLTYDSARGLINLSATTRRKTMTDEEAKAATSTPAAEEEETATVEGVITATEPTDIETEYREGGHPVFRDHILEAVHDGHGHLAMRYADVKDWGNEPRSNKHRWVKFQILAGVVNGEPVGLNLTKVTRVTGVPEREDTTWLRAAGFVYNVNLAAWVRDTTPTPDPDQVSYYTEAVTDTDTSADIEELRDGLLARGMRYSQIDSAKRLEAYERLDPATLCRAADDIAEHGWTGAPALVLDGYGTALTARHRLAATQILEDEGTEGIIPWRDMDELGPIALDINDIVDAYMEEHYIQDYTQLSFEDICDMLEGTDILRAWPDLLDREEEEEACLVWDELPSTHGEDFRLELRFHRAEGRRCAAEEHLFDLDDEVFSTCCEIAGMDPSYVLPSWIEDRTEEALRYISEMPKTVEAIEFPEEERVAVTRKHQTRARDNLIGALTAFEAKVAEEGLGGMHEISVKRAIQVAENKAKKRKHQSGVVYSCPAPQRLADMLEVVTDEAWRVAGELNKAADGGRGEYEKRLDSAKASNIVQIVAACLSDAVIEGPLTENWDNFRRAVDAYEELCTIMCEELITFFDD